MHKLAPKINITFFILFFMGLLWGCSEKPNEPIPISKEKAYPEEASPLPEPDADLSEGAQEDPNCAFFFEETDACGIGRAEAEVYWQILLDDNIFQDDSMKLTGLVIDDIDGNNQNDMLVMVLEAVETPAYPTYGSGCLWFYMNEDEPYCFTSNDCSFCGWFDAFWADIDNDENIEIIFSAQGNGVGAVGDFYKAIFKYKDHKIERMELPTDFEYDYECGLCISVFQEPEENSYSAYCPYFNETISFRALNVENWQLPYTTQEAGNNVRGFYDLRCVKYNGKNALQASEYLCGEGGVIHNIATAKFIITWDEAGTPSVDKWWIEADTNNWANAHESRITYDNGYYYYASQLDHYYLYRVKEDGSQPQCLAKIHAGNILVQDDCIYFINYSDQQGIYRMKTDGSEMEKLCDCGKEMQISGEYLYFRSVYDETYDLQGLVTKEPSDLNDDFLYRMKKDGSGRELLLADIDQFVLADFYDSQNIHYTGFIYCSRPDRGLENMVVSRYDLEGKTEKEICSFDFDGNIAVYGNYIFCLSTQYGEERGKISRYELGNGEIKLLPTPPCVDFCIYNGHIYGIDEQTVEGKKKIYVYWMDLDGESCKTIYQNQFDCPRIERLTISDLYATGEGVFLRKFVSSEEGCDWFKLTDTGALEKWEDASAVPSVLPASMLEYGELRSVKSVMESTKGYEAYMAADLEYEEFYRTENGEKYNPYTIRLPQFRSQIAGYRKINAYFQNAYQEALLEKENFFQMLKETDDSIWHDTWRQSTEYDYIYIGEHYITVAQYESGYQGGMREWYLEAPVTFDRQTGRVITLEELLDLSEQEITSKLTASIYKYMECVWRGDFFLTTNDILTEKYHTDQFFLFPEGIGLYYQRNAIDSNAAGDFVFIIPWDEVK